MRVGLLNIKNLLVYFYMMFKVWIKVFLFILFVFVFYFWKILFFDNYIPQDDSDV